MLPVCPVVIPLFAAALLAALTKRISQRFSQAIALAATIAVLGSDYLLLRISATQPIVYWFGNWRPRQGTALGISFAIDPAGAGLAAFAALLTLAALVFSSEYFDTVDNYFHALLLGFLAAMSGFCLTGDLFNMFVFFELMSAAAFALCGYKTDDPASLQGALNFAVTNTIAAYFVLTGIGLLYARTGALNMAQIGRVLESGPRDSLVLIAFSLLVCGYLVKAAIVPFHFWLADAHAVAPSPVCILFSGVMVEMGLYAFARIWWAVFAVQLHAHSYGFSVLFVSMGAGTAGLGAAMCWVQRNLKRLLAFSTISHVGLMTIGIGTLTPAGLAGAAVYVLGHGMVKAGLFLVAGILLHRFESVDECDLRGRGRGERAAAIVFIAGAIGLAGAPLSGLAAGHSLMNAAAESAGFAWAGWLSVCAAVLTSAAALRAGGRIFFGWGPQDDPGSAPRQEEKPETKEGHQHTPLSMILPASVLVLAGLVLGLLPGLKQAASVAAINFENTNGYAALVLEGAPMPIPAPGPAVPAGTWIGLLAVSAALAIAGAYLFVPGVQRLTAAASGPVQLLHRIHSGHPGDYVAFLTFGIAGFGLLCAYCFG
jgi:multicomponent Na+:H+ antiporter subunit D